MANIINLATETKQDEIIANVVNVKETVNAVNTNVNNVNTNVNANKSTLATVNAILGAPTSGASNATGGNAHAKLNWLLNSVASANSNASSASSNAYYANLLNAKTKLDLNLLSSEYPNAGTVEYSGKYLLLDVVIQTASDNEASLNIDGTIYKIPSGAMAFTYPMITVKSILRLREDRINRGRITLTAGSVLMF
ncbi:hypothetical protein ACFSY7_17965 [Kurthia populi]|uniref:Uncharacterized protein n=1 Tax=Kurthia populi TaxID=1562132 RepID=A0ABW5Y4W5_9BACL